MRDDLAITHLQIEAADECAVAPGLKDDCAVLDHRRRHAVVRMAADKHINAIDLAGQFHVLRKAQVREHDDEVHGFDIAQALDPARKFLAADREADALAE